MGSEIAVDFRTVPCNEYCQRIADGTHDSPKEAEHGRRLVTSKNVKNGRLVLDSAYLISEAEFNEINRRSKVDQWDLLLTMIGTVGEVCVVEQAEPDFTIKNVGLLKCGAEHRAKWLYYFLRSPQGQGLIEQRKKGSTQQYISLSEIRNLPISFPNDEANLRGMVSVLSLLDDRITLLREANATLEAIAQALFKSWFVDFDPVRAKMEGRAPEGMDEATAALFPDSLEESELGLVPKGWRVAKFEDFVQRLPVGKKFDQKTASAHGNVPILDQGKSGVIGYHDEDPGVRASLDEPVVVFANHTCYMRLITYDFSVIQNVLPFKGKGIDTVWAYYATKGRVKFSEYKGHWPDFTIEKALIPSMCLGEAFRSFVDPLMRRVRLNEVQSDSLANLRDTLLPRLISGQLRLPEAQKEIMQAFE